MPACLVEMAFISNPAEAVLLGSAAFQKAAATAIAQGVANYLGVELLEPVGPGTVRIIMDGQVLTGLLIDDQALRPDAGLGRSPGTDGGVG